MTFEVWMKVGLPGRLRKKAGRQVFETMTELERAGTIKEQGLPPVLSIAEKMCSCDSLRNATVIRAMLQLHRASADIEYTIREGGVVDDFDNR
jgi:hypothetical protein